MFEYKIKRSLFKMRNTTYLLIIALAVLFITAGLPCAAIAGITWDDDTLPFDEFRFAVEDNGGTFIYEPSEYFQSSSDTEYCSYRFTQGETDPYDCVANGDLEEFITPQGNIRLKAMAKGPDGGVSPPNGLKVQGYLETIPSDLTIDNALDTKQTVQAWVNRRLSVDQEGTYTLNAALSGAVNFIAYYNDPNDQAVYSVEGTVALEEIIDDNGVEVFIPMFTESLSDSDPTLVKGVRLKPQTDAGQTVTYRLRITLTLTSNIVNYDPQPYQVNRIVDGTYQLGSPSEPFILNATLSPKGNVSSWMNLLLFDD